MGNSGKGKGEFAGHSIDFFGVVQGFGADDY
jgi:hypothetical protein